jgi:hypothetical protein
MPTADELARDIYRELDPNEERAKRESSDTEMGVKSRR